MPLTHARPNIALYLAGFLILAMAVYGPIVQPLNYHHFADQRALSVISHAGDVLSNLAFLFAAMYGAFRMWRLRRFDPAQAVFVGALALTAAGSSWYHLAPDNARLVWDRLPIAIACAALLAGALKETYPTLKRALPVLAVLGALSVLWWSLTADLRPYLLIQGMPLLLIPVLQWQSDAPLGRRIAFTLAIIMYVFAKMFELADVQVFQAFGVLSGHTIKHLLAAAAAIVLIRQFDGKLA
ncbi:MAG: alkaline phytoceramidase [Pseudomonadota bacterium]